MVGKCSVRSHAGFSEKTEATACAAPGTFSEPESCPAIRSLELNSDFDRAQPSCRPPDLLQNSHPFEQRPDVACRKSMLIADWKRLHS